MVSLGLDTQLSSVRHRILFCLKHPAPLKGNSKALTEVETEDITKIIYCQNKEELFGVHIIGIHASDLIQKAANAIAKRESVQNLSFNIHTHPTLSEVLDEADKCAQIAMIWYF